MNVLCRRTRTVGAKRLAVSSCLPVCPSVRTKQPCSHWTDFREILYWDFYEDLLIMFKFRQNLIEFEERCMKTQDVYDILLNSSKN